MPCRIPSHNHDWPRSGTLSISKCEFKCDFCSSTKDYKPASALRKHVLTHIKNDKMPLTLDKSTGGRPRLQITAIDPPSRHQPETHTRSVELTLTSEPVLGALDAQDETINIVDDIVLSLKDMFPREYDNPTYSSRFSHVPDALMMIETAVVLVKTLGPEKTLILSGLDALRLCMVECRGPYHTIHDSNDCRRPFRYTFSKQYTEFFKASYDSARNLEYSYFQFFTNDDPTLFLIHLNSPTTSAMLLETFYAMWIISLMIRFNYAHKDRGLVSQALDSAFRPMLRVFEPIHMTLGEICDVVVHRADPAVYRASSHYPEIYRSTIADIAHELAKGYARKCFSSQILP